MMRGSGLRNFSQSHRVMRRTIIGGKAVLQALHRNPVSVRNCIAATAVNAAIFTDVAPISKRGIA